MPAGLESDLALTNPRRHARDAEYQRNCALVTQALEVRRRGFDVQVRAFTDRTQLLSARSTRAIERAWGRDYTLGGRPAGPRARVPGHGSRRPRHRVDRSPPYLRPRLQRREHRRSVRFVDAQGNLPLRRRTSGMPPTIRYLRLDDLPLGRVADVLELVREPDAPLADTDAMRNDGGYPAGRLRGGCGHRAGAGRDDGGQPRDSGGVAGAPDRAAAAERGDDAGRCTLGCGGRRPWSTWRLRRRYGNGSGSSPRARTTTA